MLFNSKVKDIPAWSTWLVCGNLKYLVLTNYDVNYLCKVIKLPQVAIGRPDFRISRTIWSFSNNNGKKAMRLDWQNNNFAAASRFFVNFLAIVAWLQCDRAYLTSHFVEDGNTTTTFFSFPELSYYPLELIYQLQKKLMKWNKCEKF